jgi:hypothetical protein
MRVEIHTYEELRQFATKFGEGHFNLIILIGSAGLQKSRTMREVVSDARYLEGGKLSPFELYRELYEYRDWKIILDDIDEMERNRELVRLLKCLCQTEKSKRVGWHTASTRLPVDAWGEPVTEFRTESQVCIIANEWRTLNKNVVALGDRGILLAFEPSAREVHEQVKTWFRDREILAFFEAHLDDIHEPTMRTYGHALEMKRAGLDWRLYTLQEWRKPIEPELAVLKLRDMDLPESEKVTIFRTWTGMSRATYFRVKAHLESAGGLVRH